MAAFFIILLILSGIISILAMGNNEEKMGCWKHLYSGIHFISMYSMLFLAGAAFNIIDYVGLFVTTAIITILLLLISIVSIIVCRDRGSIANTAFWAVMLLFLAYQLYNQPSAKTNTITQIRLENGSNLYFMSDTTHFCDWNVERHEVFTIVKADSTFCWYDKCINCGLGIAKHYEQQETQEQHQKKLDKEKTENWDYDQFLYNYF